MTLLNAARLALGAVALLQPRRVAAWWGADPGSGATVGAVRVLGARHLAQAVNSTVHPTPGTRTLSSAVDLLHAASMLGLAMVSPRLRRPAMTSASIAIVCAAGALHHAPGAAVQPPSRNNDASAPYRAGLSAQPTEVNQLLCGALVVVCAVATLDEREPTGSAAELSGRPVPRQVGSGQRTYGRTHHRLHLSGR
jgi:hypothetical protein